MRLSTTVDRQCSLVYDCRQQLSWCRGLDPSPGAGSVRTVGRRVDVDELIDAQEVAAMLDLAQANSVYLYLSRYPDMPRPVVDRGPRRAKLWLRAEIAQWASSRGRSG